MTTALSSAPTLFSLSELKADRNLVASIIRLANDAFLRPKKLDPVKWSSTGLRFPTIESYLEMLDEKSVVALLFDDSINKNKVGLNEFEGTETGDGRWAGKKVIGCAAAVPWKGGWTKEGAGIEEGYEIKAVCLDGDAKYARQGMAVQLLAVLEQDLVAQKRLQRRGSVDRNGNEPAEGKLTLWILAAECLNGVYWRKRGYQEVRRSTQGPGVWGCQTSFEIVVLKRDVRFDIAA
ncbi:Nn.00g015190.m01.CDS01 [Neocucurbitaria sp. VM-36]